MAISQFSILLGWHLCNFLLSSKFDLKKSSENQSLRKRQFETIGTTNVQQDANMLLGVAKFNHGN